MPVPFVAASCVAIAIAVVAAAHDLRFGTIPNWLSVPPIFLAPVAYGFLVSLGHGVQSAGAAILAGLGPYIVFRLGGMGGGDVKLFMSLGAVTGFDPMAGLRVQLIAFLAAISIVLSLQASRRRLGSTLSALVVSAMYCVLPIRRRRPSPEIIRMPVRMGAPILVGTLLALLPHLERP